MGAGNNQAQAVAVKRRGAHTSLAVPVLPTRWTSLQGCADWEWKTKQKLKVFHSYPKIHLPNTTDAGNSLPRALGCVQGRQERIQFLNTSVPLKIFVISDLCCCSDPIFAKKCVLKAVPISLNIQKIFAVQYSEVLRVPPSSLQACRKKEGRRNLLVLPGN